jgi:hypothetical protein
MFIKILNLLPYSDWREDAPKKKIFDNIVQIDHIKEGDQLTNQLLWYQSFTKFPNVLTNLIVEFAVSRRPLVYVSIAVDFRMLSETVHFQPALLVALSTYCKQEKKPTKLIPMLKLLEEDEHDILWAWQKTAANNLVNFLVRPPLHTNKMDLVQRVRGPGTTVIAFNHAGYVAKGYVWDSSKVPFSPTTSFTGALLLGDHAVGKKYAVLAALTRINDIAPTSRAHSGRISRKGIVIVTTAAKMFSWKTAVKAIIPSNWKVIFINCEKTFLTQLNNPAFASADLVVVSRHAVSAAATSYSLSAHKEILYTMQWRAAVYDEVESLVATKPMKEDNLTLDRKAIIIKSLFLGHHTIVLSSDMSDWTDNMFDACIYLVGVTQNSATIYPPPVSFSDALNEHYEHLFGPSGGQRYVIKKTTREDIIGHFLAHHVLKTLGHASLAPALLKYSRHDGAIEQGGLLPCEETEKINSIASAYRCEPNMVALSRLVIFLASQPKNKVLVYDHDNMDYNAFRERLEEHELFITPFPGNRSLPQLKRFRESGSLEGPSEKHVIVVGDCQGGDLHFPSVTHIIILGDRTRNRTYQDSSKCGSFLNRATRYGLLVGKPIVKINCV